MINRQTKRPSATFWLIVLVFCSIWPPAVIVWAVCAIGAFRGAFKRAEKQVLAQQDVRT